MKKPVNDALGVEVTEGHGELGRVEAHVELRQRVLLVQAHEQLACENYVMLRHNAWKYIVVKKHSYESW